MILMMKSKFVLMSAGLGLYWKVCVSVGKFVFMSPGLCLCWQVCVSVGMFMLAENALILKYQHVCANFFQTLPTLRNGHKLANMNHKHF